MSAIRFRYDESDLPNQFDAREKWTNLNSDVLDQGWCGASWAFSTASVASDRFVIDSKGPSINDVTSFSFLTPSSPQLPGGQFSASDKWTKLSQQFLLSFLQLVWIPFYTKQNISWFSMTPSITFYQLIRKKNRKGGSFDRTRNPLQVS